MLTVRLELVGRLGETSVGLESHHHIGTICFRSNSAAFHLLQASLRWLEHQASKFEGLVNSGDLAME